MFNSNFRLIPSKTLTTNDFELTVPDLYEGHSLLFRRLKIGKKLWNTRKYELDYYQKSVSTTLEQRIILRKRFAYIL